LILLLMMSWSSFSQTVTDTTSIQLEKPIARLVIKDLITGDGAKEELIFTQEKVSLLEQKIVLKDSIIFTLNSKVDNCLYLVGTKDDQLTLSQELITRLQLDLQTEKLKTKLFSGIGIVTVIATVLILGR
jgi:hypothetical protein